MVFINTTETIGVIIGQGTTSLTGSIVASLLLMLVILMAIALMFGIEFEFTAVIFLPLCIGMGAYYSNIMGPIIVILIYVSSIIAKNWLFR